MEMSVPQLCNLVDLRLKVDGVYYCKLHVSQQLLPTTHRLVSDKLIVQQDNVLAYMARYSDLNVSRGNVTTLYGIVGYCLTAKFLLSSDLTVN